MLQSSVIRLAISSSAVPGLALLAACGIAETAIKPAAMTALASAPEATWLNLPSDPYKGKRDDIHFATARTGYYGTGSGDLFSTVDG